MPNYDKFLEGSATAADWSGGFSNDPDFIINRHAVSLVIGRGASNLTAQTVRIASAMTGRPQATTGTGDNSSAGADLIVIGDAAFDVQRGDFFKYLGTRYDVIYVDKTAPTKVEAKAKARQ